MNYAGMANVICRMQDHNQSLRESQEAVGIDNESEFVFKQIEIPVKCPKESGQPKRYTEKCRHWCTKFSNHLLLKRSQKLT